MLRRTRKSATATPIDPGLASGCCQVSTTESPWRDAPVTGAGVANTRERSAKGTVTLQWCRGLAASSGSWTDGSQGTPPETLWPPLEEEYSAKMTPPRYRRTCPEVAATAAFQASAWSSCSLVMPRYTWHESVAQMSAPSACTAFLVPDTTP